jgi:tetratricopeptide (TPR) repeat protein
MRYAAGLLAALLGMSCASARPPAAPFSSLFPLPPPLEARLAEADALAARGCYVCLQQAAGAYTNLIQSTDNPIVIRRALENDLMMAIREIELRLPDSGARMEAEQLQEHATSSYDAYFDALDAIADPIVLGGTGIEEFRRKEAERRVLAGRLEREWPASAAGAYFYIATSLSARQLNDLQLQIPAILDSHPENLAVRYRVQAYPAMFAEDAARALIAAEPQFAEVHLLLAQRAANSAQLVAAHQELTEAYATLPDSLAVVLAFGRLELQFARYPPALAMFDRALARGPDESAQLGRAITLSYLKRHNEAIAALDELLKNLQSSPGDKYYWRAWNHLQLGALEPAYADATAALKAMASSDAYRLAGIASFSLKRPIEARGYFESSLKMNAGDCESTRYLGHLDVAERRWSPAVTRFSAAAACYQRLIEKMSAELAEKERDNSGLFVGQIAGLFADISEAKAMLELSSYNAEVSARNAGSSRAAEPAQ